MQQTMNKNDLIRIIRSLGVIERLNIITDIWDEIKESQELEAVSEEEKQLLRNRLAHYKANPDSAVDWTKLRDEIYDKYNKHHSHIEVGKLHGKSSPSLCSRTQSC